jgi:hypothetical protein
MSSCHDECSGTQRDTWAHLCLEFGSQTTPSKSISACCLGLSRAAHTSRQLVVPPLELLCAILLLTGTAVRLAAMVLAVLLLSFIIAVAINMVRGRTLDCHCFGKAARRPIGWTLLLQDCLLLVIAVAVATYTHSWVLPETWSLFGHGGVVAAGNSIPLLIGLMLTVAAICLARGTASVQRKRPTAAAKS